MAVHYKFVSSTDYGTVKFDGEWITVADLKLAISAQKKLDRSGDMDLLITNATTGKGPFGAASLRPRPSLSPAHEPNGRSARHSLEPTHVPDAFLLGLLQSTRTRGYLF
jgi:hypothetical protein